MNNLIAQLQDGCDILYLVCHGALIDGNKPMLYLVGEDGKTQAVPGNDLVTRISDLDRPPRLVVLASCQSAGSGDDAHSNDEGALAALGPRLTETSVPAVVAMQGNVTIGTAAAFMQVFFKQLQMDGQIDRAMAAARGAVSDRPKHGNYRAAELHSFLIPSESFPVTPCDPIRSSCALKAGV